MSRCRIANITFTILTALLFISTLASQTAYRAGGVNFPDWAGIGKTNSTLEKRNYQRMPQLDLEDALQGAFQAKVNEYLSDSIPHRDSILLADAAADYLLIRIANSVFGFDVIPTYFSSEYFVSASEGRLYPALLTNDRHHIQRIAAFVNRLNDLAISKPSCAFSYYLGEYAAASRNNPVSNYVTNPLTHDQIANYTQQHLDEAICFESDLFDTATYKKTHFLTDFHWNIYGAYDGYISIMRALDQDASPVRMGETFPCNYPRYFGNFARGGLSLVVDTDRVVDCYFELPEYEVTTGKSTGDGTLLSALTPSNYSTFSFNPDITTERYSELFPGRAGGLTEIINPAASNGRTLVIMGDSFARPIDRLIASHFHKTILYNPAEHESSSLPDIIEEYHPDDVLILLSAYSLFTHTEYSDALID